MDIIYFILIPAIVSLTVSIWFGRKMVSKSVEIMEEIYSDTEENNQEMQEIVLDAIRELRRKI